LKNKISKVFVGTLVSDMVGDIAGFKTDRKPMGHSRWFNSLSFGDIIY